MVCLVSSGAVVLFFLGVGIFRIGWVYIFGVLGASLSCQIEPFYFVLFPCIPGVIVIKF